MQDYRCCACKKLLFRIAGEAVVAVKCPRCKCLNSLTLTQNQPTFLNATSVPSERLERHLTKGRNHGTINQTNL